MSPLILIPARFAATRLPGKPMLEIGGAPMIVQVWRRAIAAHMGEVAVATDHPDIATVITAEGGRAIMTRADHASGSDRIYEALQSIDPEKKYYDIIINLQGDMPTLDPGVIAQVLAPLSDGDVDIATLAAIITEEREKTDPAVVKAVLAAKITDDSTQMTKTPASYHPPCVIRHPSPYRALDFTRNTPKTGEPFYHHIGLYAYRRAALERFVALPPSPREKAEKLEQLRAMENGMRIDVNVVNTVPLGVDTPETLEIAREYYATQTI